MLVYQDERSNKTYGALSIGEEDGIPLVQYESTASNNFWKNSPVANFIVFVSTFIFYGYCVFEALSPVSLHGSKSHCHIGMYYHPVITAQLSQRHHQKVTTVPLSM